MPNFFQSSPLSSHLLPKRELFFPHLDTHLHQTPDFCGEKERPGLWAFLLSPLVCIACRHHERKASWSRVRNPTSKHGTLGSRARCFTELKAATPGRATFGPASQTLVGISEDMVIVFGRCTYVASPAWQCYRGDCSVLSIVRTTSLV